MTGSNVLAPGSTRITGRRALSLPRGGGDLAIVEGAAWLTRSMDGHDHFVAAPARLQVRPGDRVVVEAAYSSTEVLVHWTPRPPGLLRWLARRWIALQSASSYSTVKGAWSENRWSL